MTTRIHLNTAVRPALLLLFAHGAFAAVTVTPSMPDGIYETGHTIRWSVAGAEGGPLDYHILRDNKQVVRSGQVGIKDGRGSVEFLPDKPGTFLLELAVKSEGAAGSAPTILGGAAVQPENLVRSALRPADFDAFWSTKLTELASVPANPRLTPAPSDKPGVSRWLITMDMPHGAAIRGQIARPEKGEKFPAIVLFQYAGVYPLPVANVTSKAAQGWLALNIMAHDLPIDQPAAYYEKEKTGPLDNYPMIGCEDRETSYFLRMFLACSRAVDYLASRPDWDGRVLVVSGTSQSGLQSIVAAGLNPRVTAVMVLVPAGCDATASLAGRGVPWPFWGQKMPAERSEAALRTAPYYDGINFASRIKCPVLVGLGLLDTTATPAGVLLMARELRGRVEKVVMVSANHKGDHAAYQARAKAWLESIRRTGSPPQP